VGDSERNPAEDDHRHRRIGQSDHEKIKARDCGFRHRPRSRMAILFDKREGGLTASRDL